MAVTAKDVARAAGVSQATVSYVINDNPNQRITPATRARVLAAVAELGYTPSAAARALRKGTSDVVLLLLPDIPIGPTAARIMEAFTDDLEPFGLTAVTRRMRAGKSATDAWREVRPVAIVALGTLTDVEAEALRIAEIPMLSTTFSPISGGSGASVPQVPIGRLQVEHLAATGHRTIGYAAPDDARVNDFFRRRLDGVRSACLDLGLDDPVVLPVHLDARHAEAAVRAWLGRAVPVTAVCAYNDDTAFALLAGLHRAGLSAPRDLAVIGVDNIPLASLASPPLTTIDQNVDRLVDYLAREVAHLVLNGPAPMPLRSDAVSLVIRESA